MKLHYIGMRTILIALLLTVSACMNNSTPNSDIQNHSLPMKEDQRNADESKPFTLDVNEIESITLNKTQLNSKEDILAFASYVSPATRFIGESPADLTATVIIEKKDKSTLKLIFSGVGTNFSLDGVGPSYSVNTPDSNKISFVEWIQIIQNRSNKSSK
jgi:hypothetical protein